MFRISKETWIKSEGVTLVPKSFDYQFLDTLDERGQGIPTMWIKEGGERVTNVTRIITKLKDDSTEE